MNQNQPNEIESPIACNVDPFSPDERRRWQELGSRWQASVQELRELPDGYAFRIPSDAAAVIAAAEWMTLDRICCPFLGFALEIEREHGPVWLRITGSDGAKAMLREEIGRRSP